MIEDGKAIFWKLLSSMIPIIRFYIRNWCLLFPSVNSCFQSLAFVSLYDNNILPTMCNVVRHLRMYETVGTSLSVISRFSIDICDIMLAGTEDGGGAGH